VSRTAPQQDIYTALDAAGKRYVHCAADLSQSSSIAAVVEMTLAQFGKIDILVNNAGVILRGPFLEYSESDWDETLMTNLKIPVFLAQACAREMIAHKTRGKIINICSMLSYQGGINAIGYASAKHGLAGATRAMANELAAKGINVNGLAPGYVKTDSTIALQRDTNRYDAILARIPTGRWADPVDIAGAAVFLASPASDYVNGHILDVDGGWMSR
jgi:2-deoxy-D-gluconate 3-dehydrogenase